MSGSYCPVCIEDSGIDAEEWYLKHDDKPATCQNCGARLSVAYEEYGESGDSWWVFEKADD